MSIQNKIKVTNPNQFDVGLKLMDGKTEVVVRRGSFNYLEPVEIEWLHQMCKTFTKKHLLIEDEELNLQFGFIEKTIANYSNDELAGLLKGSITKLKKELEKETEKHIIDKVVSIAKTIEDLAKNKITFLQEWSGYDFDLLIQDDENKTK